MRKRSQQPPAETTDASDPGTPRPTPAGEVAIRTPDGKLIHRANRQVTRSVRYLLARLQLNDATGLPNRLALTSALRGEGVTYVASTLAALIADDLQRDVCIVDLNWRAPGRASEDAWPGVSDAMAGEATIDRILQPTSDPRLALVSSGSPPQPGRPALAEDAELDRVLTELAARFDHLLLDLPPVLVSSDALSLARYCDAYALVVRQGVTSEHHVKEAIDELRGAVLLGVILNRASSKIPKRIANLVSWSQ